METGEAMNATQEIKITGKEHEELSWKRYVYFEYQGKEYVVILFWDEFNGYEIYWKNSESGLINSQEAPDWVVNWDEDEHEGMSFGHYLDEITYQWKPSRNNPDLFDDLVSSAERLIQLTGEKKNG